jgi:hypothetical protein
MNSYSKISTVLSFALITTALTGCAGPKNWQAQNDFATQFAGQKQVGLVVQGVTVKEIATGGDATLDQERSREAKATLEQGAAKAFAAAGHGVTPIPTSEPDVARMLAGYNPIHREIGSHFPGAASPPVGPKSIAGISAVLDKYGVECVAILSGLDHVSSAGRKAAMVAMALFVKLGNGIAYTDLVIACRDGRPLYVSTAQGDRYKLTNESDAQEMTTVMLRGVRELRPQ